MVKAYEADEVLIQFRVPRPIAEQIRQRAAEIGAPVTQWIREAIARDLAKPELSAWFVDDSELRDNARLRTFEHGSMNPHLQLVVLNWAGNFLGVNARGGPAQGRPPTSLLSLSDLKAIFGRDVLADRVYVRGSGLWRVAHAFDVSKQPAHLQLEFEDRPSFIDRGR